MKKALSLLGLALILPTAAYAADDAGKFYQNLLITDEIIAEENEGIAIENARRLLNTKPKVMQIKDNKVVSRPTRKTAQPNEEKVDYGTAPFGLAWGESAEKVKNLGVILTKTGEKDYVNNFTATHLPKSLHDFRDVVLTFGIDNKLWRIIAYGKFLKDDSSASEVLDMYHRYYKLLSQKYGNAKEFYTPKVVNVDKTVPDAKGKPQTVTEQKSLPIGGSDFLNELKNGEADLYATFENGVVGVALAVNVDGSGQSYIVVDYKNLKLMKEREQQTLDAL